MTSVLVADDHALFRQGLVRVLLDAGLDVIGEAGDGNEAIRIVRERAPDVVLMDLHMPDCDGIAATLEVADETRVLVLTVSEEDDDLYRAIKAGARGYLLKNVGPRDLVEAVRAVAAGDAVLSPEMTATAFAGLRGRVPKTALDDLSGREREVLGLIARGLSNRAVAGKLAISEHTVKTYVERIFEKLGVNSRAEAAVIAGEHGID